jgi:hypothetical protein
VKSGLKSCHFLAYFDIFSRRKIEIHGKLTFLKVTGRKNAVKGSQRAEKSKNGARNEQNM